ncbi:octopamine receptor 1-like [Patiria miniata]|uniref:G-protein coupled receptors family 1 profile domain-containing protein n=1 Tax=Patiria miniata TaxID=46514 RepID=A0A914AQJ1_PATMI|nr:octopamine receptor 1-like [Patiria miniata]
MERLQITTIGTGQNTTDVALTGGEFADDVERRHVFGTVLSAVFLLIIIVLSILGNIAVIMAVLKTPRLREKTSSIFLINLSMTDLSNATLVMPSTLVSLIAGQWPFGMFWCYAQCAFNYWFIIVSMLTLAMISIDGFYAVIHPLHYMNIITPKVTKIGICYAWFQGCVFALIPAIYRWVVYDYWEVVCAIDWDSYSQDGALTYVIVAFVVCFLIPGIVMTYCYTRICRVARQKAAAAPAERGGKNARKLINDKRVIQSLALIVAIFFLCMTPFCVTKLIKIFTSTSALPPYLYLVSSWFGYLASATNPFVYAIFRRDFRRAFANLFCRGRIFPGFATSSQDATIRMSNTEHRRRTQVQNNDTNTVTQLTERIEFQS